MGQLMTERRPGITAGFRQLGLLFSESDNLIFYIRLNFCETGRKVVS